MNLELDLCEGPPCRPTYGCAFEIVVAILLGISGTLLKESAGKLPFAFRPAVRQAVRQAHGPEPGRWTHGPEPGRWTHGSE